MLGIKSEEGLAGGRPSQVLKPLIEQYAAQLQANSSDAKAKEDLAGLSRRLQAIEYVAADDLQRTVLLEREWAELLARAVHARSGTEGADRGGARPAAVRRSSGHADVSQLRDGQAALLRLWLLESTRMTTRRAAPAVEGGGLCPWRCWPDCWPEERRRGR